MMTHRAALEVLAQVRGEQIVVTTMGSVAIWPQMSDSPLDFHYLPSSMGQAVPLGLGLCFARPGRGVIVLTGDGGLLMNLGCLVTAAQFPVPLYIVLIDNGLYEVTGGQAVANASRTDFAALARAAGIGRVYACATSEEWAAVAPEAVTGSGPVFVHLKVQGEIGKPTPSAPRPMADQIARLRSALGA
ncbi:Acetolactate synthase isozyme 1 large subunit [Gemmata sp. SH-PL17]|uniref:thiamine pyrophosphate-dependent enzyme n=1 Tax=Gemmata sp. SH-PL17 TaxID=1630693 RepID=UPI00078CA45F|nr:thiamine pyrophosphate-dependent enzyme [Gemmata sp. SH-PL17]AMV28414.1 Acetolactate synthase isozyme 1 large subunit [Gemmata sp. SH-PL17]